MGISAIDSGTSRDSENHVFRDRISLLKIHVLSIQSPTLRFAIDHRSYRTRDARCPITHNNYEPLITDINLFYRVFEVTLSHTFCVCNTG